MAATFTVNLNLAKPATGDLDWGPEVDANFDVMDACGFANREDRFIRVFGGGTLTYDAVTGNISFTQDIIIHHGVTGFLTTIPATESPFVASAAYHLTYFLMTRNPQVNETLTTLGGKIFRDEIVVPSSNNSFVFALRDATLPTNQIVLFNGQLLQDGKPGSIQGGSFLTLTQAYNNSLVGEIALASDSKYFRVRAMDAPVDTLIQQALSAAANDPFANPSPAGYAIQFSVTQLSDISRIVTRLGKVGTPPGNWQYKIVKDNGLNLPSTLVGDIEYTGTLHSCASLPIVAADQDEVGAPTLVELIPGTYWLEVAVDATYLAGTDSLNKITIAESSAGGAPRLATYNATTTTWTLSVGANYYHQIFKGVVSPGNELLAVSQASGGLVSIKNHAKMLATGTVEFDSYHTGLVGLPVAQITTPSQIVLGTDQQILSIAAGDDIMLRLSPNAANNGLYRVLSVTVESPAAGQSTIVIDQTASLANSGYKTALAVAETGLATVADVLRAADSQGVFSQYDLQSLLWAKFDAFRKQFILNGDMLISGKILNTAGPLLLQDTNSGGKTLALSASGTDYTLFASLYGSNASLLAALNKAGQLANDGGTAPAQLQAESPATSKLDILAGPFIDSQGIAIELPPESNLVPSIPSSSIDFQTHATAGATFNVTWPTGSTIGFFRRVGFAILGNSQVNVVFSAEAATLVACANPGTLFPLGTPLGWIDVQCTSTAPDAFKTAGSLTNIIENAPGGTSAIHIFKTGGGGSSGAGSGAQFNVVQEPLAGAVDGTNAVFNTSNVPISAACILVMTNRGIVPSAGWSYAGGQITFKPGYIPQIGQQVYAWYIVGLNFGPGVVAVTYGTLAAPVATGGTTAITINTQGDAVIFLKSTGGAVSTTADPPFVNTGAQLGRFFTFVGTSDVDHVTIPFSAKFRLNGPIDMVADKILVMLCVDEVNGVYTEVSRSM